ncbi:4'-phosphopantetheinyl transferase family protein [Flavobacterium oreochromis]|uniref:4-phosphopantetheinyl transferase n=2 Tax=Flavobacterium TaxID=237 RepID=A0A246GCE7_9FLAO|nr:4'-phosphopantetheinyl transferase superfamily protein [Flavobacterium oreochromis]OWP78174.1 4-phosphopantetheinyl transferase [Flavobacterium oreochromis]OWP78815.1 4-phosphopantetheinyl transferase [Flavobacterium oreochromis]POR24998.1 4-phosphopantetheinyl transferase [Flavobacterium columnare]QYS87530.1 4'-phosphopantetheinyl transferase superfamily protein [Flavobacterium oreochromis]
MPFYKKIDFSERITVYLWKITETYNELFETVSLKEESIIRLKKMRSESHQKSFLAVRMLLQHCGYTDYDLYYDQRGKPMLNLDNSKIPVEISISHSSSFSALALSKEPVGIDLERIKEKVLRIAPRYMNMKHIESLPIENQIQKATVIWGIKESIFKIKNEIGISFPDHIFEKTFNLDDKQCKAELHFNNKIEYFSIDFCVVEDYILVSAFREQKS